jgi:NitT/TauT family transport system substrate-binding protein
MPLIQTRRQLLAGLSAAGAAGLLGAGPALADEAPPEVTTIRIRRETVDNSICNAPDFVAEELLRAEGFTDIRYVFVPSGAPYSEAFAHGDVDFSLMFALGAVRRVDQGVPIKVLAGVHTGCFELFVHGSIRTVTELRGRQVGLNQVLGSAPHLYVSIMAAYVGLDPRKDIRWVTIADVPDPMELFVRGEIDAYMAYVPQPQELRARKIGQVIVNIATDKPWSQYFCCMWVGRTDFVHDYPIATKRASRAILKAADVCGTNPERAARLLVEHGLTRDYDYSRQALTEIPYASWREFDAEDSLRVFALHLHELGMLEATPNNVIAKASDWRFLNELKRELKA